MGALFWLMHEHLKKTRPYLNFKSKVQKRHKARNPQPKYTFISFYFHFIQNTAYFQECLEKSISRSLAKKIAE